MKICLLSKTSDIECNFSVELTFEYSLLPVGGNFSQIKRRSAQILLRNKYYGQIIFEFVFDFLTPCDFMIVLQAILLFVATHEVVEVLI